MEGGGWAEGASAPGSTVNAYRGATSDCVLGVPRFRLVPG